LAVVGLEVAVQAAGAVYYLTQLTMAAFYCLVSVGLCLLMGYAGQISLGQAGFFAIGGYVSAVLTTLKLDAAAPASRFLSRLGILAERRDVYENLLLGVSPWAALLAAVLATGLVALLIGMPVIRLKGHYLAMATLGFGLIVFRVVLGTRLLGEADGIGGVPALPLFGLQVSGGRAHRVESYYVAWGLVLAALLLAVNLIHSRVGRALRSIHGGEEAAGALGVDTARYKLATFVAGAVLAGVAGAFLTHYNGGIGPTEASIMKSVRYVAIVAVGGMGSLWGTLTTSLALNYLSLRGYFGSFDDAVFGGILILVMLFAPDGVLALDARRALGALRRRVRPAGDAAPRAEPEDAEPARAAAPRLPIDGDAREEGG
jgi:branched-chain amino acid transport system permease protein